jgi:drug/metabolite transporter (DMT)-like permease
VGGLLHCGAAPAQPRRTSTPPAAPAAHPPALATLSVVAGALCFATITIFVTLATRAGAPLLTVLGGRYVVAAAILVVPVVREGWPGLDARRAARIAILGGSGQAVVSFLSLSALDFLPAATLVFLFYTYPAWVAGLAAIRGTEQLNARRLTALALSLAGVTALVGLPGAATVHPTGALLALSAALAYALYIPLLQQLQQGTTPAGASLLVAAGVAVIFLVGAAVGHRLVFTLPWTAWGAIVGLGAFSTAAAFVLFLRGLAILGPVRAAVVSTAEPFFAAVMAAVVLHQPVGIPLLAGGALIAAAVVLLQTGRP